MGYVFVPPVNSTKENSPKGVNLNFNKSGVFDKLYDDAKQVRANLVHLLLTQKGERLYQPTFGSDLLKVIFEPNVDLLKEIIQNMIFDAVQYWMPYIQISVDIKTAQDDPNLIDTVKVSIDATVNEMQVETIEIFASEQGITVSNM